MEIKFLTESPSKKYSKEIRAAKTVSELFEVVEKYKRVAEDAVAKVKLMNEKDFKEFRRDLPKMVDPKESQVEELVTRWGNIVMPFKLIWSEMVADHSKAPWGTAFLRCEELGWPNEDKKHGQSK